MELKTKYNVYDMVNITAIGTTARVLVVQFNGFKIMYNIEYWMNGDFKSSVLYEDDLGPTSK